MTAHAASNHLRIDHESGVPVYEQLITQLTQRIQDGSLPVGARLPTVRQLATDLGVAANTVAKSYRLLEETGVIETRGRQGSFVAATGTRAERLAEQFAQRVRAEGLDPDEMLALAAKALGR